MERATQIKLAVAALLTVLLVIVILQNTEQVETQVLFLTIPLPRALLLAVMLLLGFITGLLFAAWRARRGK